MKKIDAKDLLDRYTDGLCKPEEKEIIESWFNTAEFEGTYPSAEKLIPKKEIIWKAISGNLNKPVVRLWPRIAAAAVFLIFLSIGFYFYNHQQNLINQAANSDLTPGSNTAVLTLSSGNKIILSGGNVGLIANENHVKIKKNKDGQVIYNADNINNSTIGAKIESAYNTLVTPRGGKYTITLSDGTIATLDAASSIRYPVSFADGERKVEITGQVYFHVVHNAHQPFLVIVKGLTIEDLGTQFNINAYDDEPVMSTTLIDGKVKVWNEIGLLVLKPGQQALGLKKSPLKLIAHADIEEVLAWKNDLFRFNNANIQTVMRQLSRWYNVEVVYEGDIPKTKFSGEIHRNVNASKVLEILRFTKLQFHIEGKKIIVTPN